MAFTASPAPTTDDARTSLAGLHAQPLDGRDSDLIPHWNTCLAKSAPESRFHTHGWYSAWLDTYGTWQAYTGQGHVVVATTAAGQTVGILPLASARKRGLRFLALAGYRQPIRTLVLDTQAAEAAAAALASALVDQSIGWDLFRIGPIELTTPGHRSFLEALRKYSSHVAIKAIEGMAVCRNLPGDFETYQEKVMGRGLLKEVQYKVRKLSRDGNVDVRHYHNPTGEDLETVLRDCRVIEARSWLPDSEEAILRFATEVDFEFWRNFIASGLPQEGGVDAWVMSFDSRPISFCFTVTAGGVRYTIGNQYDRDYAKYSTGSVIFNHVMEDACNTGVQAVNFGNGDLQYKGRWGGIEEGERVEALVFPRGLKGRSMAALFKTLKRLRPSWVKPM